MFGRALHWQCRGQRFDQFIADSEVKNRILENFGGYCTEMEGAAIAHTAYLNKVPFVILRAISDKADNSATMDYPTFEKQAIEHSVRLTMGMLKINANVLLVKCISIVSFSEPVL